VKDLFSKFSSREKAILALGALSLLALSIHALVIEPFIEKQLEVIGALDQSTIDLEWMKSAVSQLPIGNRLGQSIKFEGSLANLIDKEVRSQGLNNFLTQMTPVSDDEIRVRYKDINFNRLLGFIAQVNTQGLKVKDLRINTTDKPADVDCSLVLIKNG